MISKFEAIRLLVGGNLSGNSDGTNMSYDDGQTPPTEEEIKALKEVHETLNDANKEEFMERMKTREGLQALITFATNLQGE